MKWYAKVLFTSMILFWPNPSPAQEGAEATDSSQGRAEGYNDEGDVSYEDEYMDTFGEDALPEEKRRCLSIPTFT